MEFISIDIMNSNWKDHLGKKSEDRLDDTSWLKALLGRYGFPPEAAMDKSFVSGLKELRDIMKQAAHKVVEGHSVDKVSIERLNKYLTGSVHKYHIEQDTDEVKLKEVLLENSNESLLGQIALSFAELITKQDTRRLKICRNPDCCWIFFDESKNRNKCWCESKTCGNLMKVRNYRERKRLEG